MAVNDHELQSVVLHLLDYCRTRDWSGHDPYDGLNSRLFSLLPVRNWKPARLVLIQGLKRSPINLRTLLGVPPTKNPKAFSLFVSSAIKLDRLRLLPDQRIVESLVSDLLELRSPDFDYWCWGYSFPWQTRGKLVPRGAANLVSTTFAANALLDAFEHLADHGYLQIAKSAAEYLVDQLYYTEGDDVASFRYPLPSTPAKVHNANFLAAALLARVFALTGDKRFLEPALRSARYSAGRQAEDGSWRYGEAPTQQWIDNFHTGYNLCALRALQRYLNTSEFDSHLAKGFEFYRKHFIREDGAARYFHDCTYPIDIHCVAQTILTLLEFSDLAADANLVERVSAWAIKNMWDEAGFFYYRILRVLTIRTPYMRWSEAWMLLALASLLEHRAESGARRADQPAVAALT